MKKTRIGTFLLSMMLIALLLLPSCSVFGPVETNPAKAEPIATEESETITEPTTPEETKEEESGQVKAQDDFYDHVNEKLIKEKSKENEGMGWDQFKDLSDKVKKDLEAIQAEITKDGIEHPAGSAEKAVSDLYKSVQDKEGREKAGLGSLEEYLTQIREADSIPAYLKAVAKIRKELGKSSLLHFQAIPNPQDSSKYALYLQEPEMLLGKMDLEDEAALEDMKAYIKELLKQSGQSEEEIEQWTEKWSPSSKNLARKPIQKKNLQTLNSQ